MFESNKNSIFLEIIKTFYFGHCAHIETNPLILKLAERLTGRRGTRLVTNHILEDL